MITLPRFPKVRALEPIWAEAETGERVLVLRDRLGLSEGVVVPQAVAVLLGLCDGTRDLDGLCASFELRTGVRLGPATVERVIGQLDDALVFDSPRFAAAETEALAAYLTAPCRPPTLADKVYPADPAALAAKLDAYADGSGEGLGPVRGLISPHIDYGRGGPLYGKIWRHAAPAVREAEVAIVFGTDHCGSPRRLTPTRQHYATPYGVLPTATAIVDQVAAAVGEKEAFAEELHHRNEHSIELAAVWLHHVRGGEPCELVPILCGSFEPYTSGAADPAGEASFAAALAALRAATAGRRTIVVAAADLAHVGPAFGDPRPYDPLDRAGLAAADNFLLDAIAVGNPAAVLGQLRAEQDKRRVCGLPPIYLTLRYLEDARGEVLGYDQCPADDERGSWVSIGGIILR